MTISKKEAKYFEQVLRKRFRDGKLTKEQIEKLKSHGFKFDPLKKPVICIETNEIFNSINKAADVHKVNKDSIYSCCRGKQNTADGYHWAYVDDEKRIAKLAEFKGKPKTIYAYAESQKARAIICIETGKIFDSIAAATRGITTVTNDINTSRKPISSCCKGKQNTAYGYHWAYADDAEHIAELAEFKGKARKKLKINPATSKRTGIRRQVICIETNEIFESIAVAANHFELKSAALISNCCQGRTKKTGGYHWAYADDAERIAELAEFKGKPRNTEKSKYTSLRAKHVICIETGEIFESIASAAKHTKLKNPSSISNCCKERQQTAYGYHWAYADDTERIEELTEFANTKKKD